MLYEVITMLKLSREGAVIMPVSPPWYRHPADLASLVSGFTDKVLRLLGEPAGEGWREGDLEGENPLYLPQAKTFDGCAAIGPGLLISADPLPETRNNFV